MDTDIARWMIEFLLRQPCLEDRIISSVMRALPLDDNNLSLKKSVCLRKIESEVSKELVSEQILEILEEIEELEHREGIEVLASMKKAYCAVAVECTVRFLDGGGSEKEVKYFDAVKRIWRGRVSKMECFEMGAGLISEGLKEWREKIEAGVWDSSACEDVLVRSKGVNVLEAVRQYVKEARERMGPSFIEIMAETVLSDDTVRVALGWGTDRVCDQGRESAPGFPNTGKDVVTDGVCDQGGESAPGIPNTGKDVVTDGDCDQGRESAPTVPKTDKDVVTDGVRDQGRERAPSALNAGKDGVTGKGDKETHAGHVSHGHKHVAIGRRRIPASITSRCVKIAGTEDMVCESHDKYQYLSSPETLRVLEALRSSCLELKAVVHDPLPSALRLGEKLRSDMARENVVHEHVVDNRSRLDDVAPSSSADRSADPLQANDGNLGNDLREKNNVPKPSLMARNNTPHVVEWDSVSDSGEASPRRPHLPSPGKRVMSPLKKDEIKKLTRRRKRWSNLEEDTLRTGVQKYGEGQWTLILRMYADIFEERTRVDLKDKWRNLTR